MGLNTINKEKTEYPPIPRDVYDVRLMDIEERQGQYGAYWSWKWEVTEEPHAGRWLFIFTDNNINPVYVRKAGKVGPRDLASILMNRPLADDEFLEGNDYLDLIDLPARASVGIAPAKDGTLRNTLDAVLPVKGAGMGAPRPKSESPQTVASPKPTPYSSTDQVLFEKYLDLRTALGWSKETAEEMIETWTERPVTFQRLPLEERKTVLKHMAALDEENDLPFNPPDADADDAPEMTAAGLVSPKVPASAGTGKGRK